MDKGRRIITDPNAESSEADKPAFIARPEGAPVYHGFGIVEESNTNGWLFGAITEYIGEQYGDGFVVAPDGSRAGLVWEVGPGEFSLILEPEPERWGVYAVWFPKAMHSTDDMVSNFRAVLPALIEAYEHAQKRG